MEFSPPQPVGSGFSHWALTTSDGIFPPPPPQWGLAFPKGISFMLVGSEAFPIGICLFLVGFPVPAVGEG